MVFSFFAFSVYSSKNSKNLVFSFSIYSVFSFGLMVQLIPRGPVLYSLLSRKVKLMQTLKNDFFEVTPKVSKHQLWHSPNFTIPSFPSFYFIENLQSYYNLGESQPRIFVIHSHLNIDDSFEKGQYSIDMAYKGLLFEWKTLHMSMFDFKLKILKPIDIFKLKIKNYNTVLSNGKNN